MGAARARTVSVPEPGRGTGGAKEGWEREGMGVERGAGGAGGGRTRRGMREAC